jgi:hypothetical protein
MVKNLIQEKTMNKINTIKQVAALPGMSIGELKTMWRNFNKTEPPPFNRAFLVKRLAYQIQELSLGGLEKETEKRLERLVKEQKGAATGKRPVDDQLLLGTRLLREWKGVEHCCTVLNDGFEYQGRRFKSLSAVANHITGTRWNGKVFFGLKKQGDKL